MNKIYKYSKERRKSFSVSQKNRYSIHGPEGTSHWKGGISKDHDGYVFIYNPYHPYANNMKYVREHRLVVEKYIKRHLNPQEMVHHIDAVKNNNSPRNLMAFINRSAHVRFEHNPNNVREEEIIFDGRKL